MSDSPPVDASTYTTMLKVEHLRSLPLLGALDERDLATVAGYWEAQNVTPGQYLYRQGEVSAGMYVWIKGTGKLTRVGEGRITDKVETIGPGEYRDGLPFNAVGETSLFLVEPREHSLHAEEDGLVLVWQGRSFNLFLTEHPEIKGRLNVRQDILRQRVDLFLEIPENRMDYINRLPLFSELSDDEREQIAPLFQVERYRSGEYVYRQGEMAAALYYMVQGRGVQLYVDDRGIERKGSPVEPDQFVGERSLFMIEERPNSLVIVRDAVMLVLTQKAFTGFINRNTRLKARLNVPKDITRLAPDHDFAWLNEGEQILHYCRRHWWVFFRRCFWAVPLFVILLPVPLLIIAAPFLPDIFAICGVVPLLLSPLLTVIYNYFDWRNDWFVVTNQRVVHEENILLAFNETRQQSPLTSIQSVTSDQEGYWQERFGFGNVIIQTAGAGGAITFDSVEDPDGIARVIQENLGKRKAHRMADDRAHIRSEIDRFLGLNVLSRTRAGDLPRPDMQYEPLRQEVTGRAAPKSGLRRRWERLMAYLDIRTRYEEGNKIIYRRHWIVLWNDIFPPTFALVAWFVVLIISLIWRNDWPWANIALPIRLGGLALWLILGLVWWFWMYDDWHNDQYVVQGDLLIRIHKRPLWLDDEQFTIPINKIQGVNTRVEGLWQRMFNYGTVVVQTAAEDSDGPNEEGGRGEILFTQVYKPYALQDDILRRQQSEKTEQRKDELDRSAEQIARWLAIYHQATHPEDFLSGDVPDDKGQAG